MAKVDAVVCDFQLGEEQTREWKNKTRRVDE